MQKARPERLPERELLALNHRPRTAVSHPDSVSIWLFLSPVELLLLPVAKRAKVTPSSPITFQIQFYWEA